jgi:stringent starvation protein B
VSWTATAQLKMSNDEVTFSGRFGGVGMGVRIPIAAVLAVYARETGQGMIFPDDESQPTPPTTPEPAGDEKPAGDAPKRPKLTVVK